MNSIDQSSINASKWLLLTAHPIALRYIACGLGPSRDRSMIYEPSLVKTSRSESFLCIAFTERQIRHLRTWCKWSRLCGDRRSRHKTSAIWRWRSWQGRENGPVLWRRSKTKPKNDTDPPLMAPWLRQGIQIKKRSWIPARFMLGLSRCVPTWELRREFTGAEMNGQREREVWAVKWCCGIT